MDVKMCTDCKIPFPKTSKYFFTKTVKKGTIVNGYPLKNNSTSFRGRCKKCHGKEGQERKRIKAAKRWGVTLEEYKCNTQKFVVQNLIKIKTKYTQFLDLSPREKDLARKALRKGYEDYENYSKQWKEKWLKKMKARRKYNYPEDMIKVPAYLANKNQIENMNPGIIANRLKIRTRELTPELINLYKNYICLLKKSKQLQSKM